MSIMVKANCGAADADKPDTMNGDNNSGQMEGERVTDNGRRAPAWNASAGGSSNVTLHKQLRLGFGDWGKMKFKTQAKVRGELAPPP